MSMFTLHPHSTPTKLIYDARFNSREKAIEYILEATKIPTEFVEVRQTMSPEIMETIRFMADELHSGIEEYGGFNGAGLVSATVVPLNETLWQASVLVSSELPVDKPPTIHGQFTDYWANLTQESDGIFDQVLVVSEHGVGMTVAGNIAREYHAIHGRNINVFTGPTNAFQWNTASPHANKKNSIEWERRHKWIPDFATLKEIPNITHLSNPELVKTFWGIDTVVIDLHSLPPVYGLWNDMTWLLNFFLQDPNYRPALLVVLSPEEVPFPGTVLRY